VPRPRARPQNFGVERSRDKDRNLENYISALDIAYSGALQISYWTWTCSVVCLRAAVVTLFRLLLLRSQTCLPCSCGLWDVLYPAFDVQETIRTPASGGLAAVNCLKPLLVSRRSLIRGCAAPAPNNVATASDSDSFQSPRIIRTKLWMRK